MRSVGEVNDALREREFNPPAQEGFVDLLAEGRFDTEFLPKVVRARVEL